jgi:hypothetical protein
MSDINCEVITIRELDPNARANGETSAERRVANSMACRKVEIRGEYGPTE